VAVVRHRLERRCHVPVGARVVVGCSGGADSLALLLAAWALRQRRVRGRPALEPRIVHVHHHLRPEADEDARFVESVCRRFELPVEIEHVRPAGERGSRAAAARALRYNALARCARAARARFVLVAHHAEDQLETVLMALARGTGLDGLCGMDWAAPLPTDGPGTGLCLVRPLLDVRKRECESLCATAGLAWREDPGNRDPSQVRGRLRRDVLPVLEALWPDAAARVGGTADLVRAARDEVERLLASAFGPPGQRSWARSDLRGLSTAIVAAGLRRAALHASPDAQDELGQRALLPAAEAVTDGVRRPREFAWPAGMCVRVTSREVVLTVR
ncbi:MAG: tRNA lysidine(34) synthetase TilS, partial [Planctomycetota bacterium]